MTFPCYPKYRTSGIEWLDQVPDHWSSVPIKYMALERNSLFLDGDWIESKDISSDGIRYITTGNVGEGAYKEQGAGFISEETFHALGCTEVYEGDVLVSRLNNPIGRACVVPDLGGRVVTSVDNVIFRPDSKFDKKFIVYLFSSEEYFKHTSNLARGATMQRISRGLLGNIRVVTPSFEEQTQIARFLDHETARIDALIEEQQRLIELLKEKRQAVISHAVTQGLDPMAPMKDSGVEWLGEVPAHWTVRKVSVDFLASKGPRGALLTKEYCHENAGEYPVYSGQTENGGILGEIADFDIDLGAEGAILSTTVGAKAMSVMHISGRISLSQNCMIIRPLSSDVKVRFFFYHFQPLFSLERRMIPDHMQPSFRMEDLYSFRVAVPPVSEQNQIAEYLDAAVNRFDELIGEGDNGIALLQERRSALISAAVTGKIDVRDWQPPASTQTPEFEVAEAH
ncbi:TPA: restriction endonuclease subunit S [Pseudomonas aeruginosa]|uniref:restriction endonuclease subunit S n=1 Tax=Pseudomonas aeruginosa TaxID=287 RepID=UPI00106CA804|nr:restriction endonuclease subunit S [Pseudomonas aeruginosa]EKV4050488.1 restriction endonuclease subunit S [Pseudomonas aeruginosa]MBG5022127.1 restriction endonuclease subunit S [Pseudomonas aeruginosa]MBG6787300.1 restriction endonuclease subunit S [Pseudomonas aeruginosa]MBH9215026.1 restriction endonuclease subunit S [Pseudomonas aeruginosa]MBH9380240.1 restriction endonuclease subunit S [Pseudomonas aeruginosa]